MALKDKSFFSPKRLSASISFALEGLFLALRKEKNIHFHLLAAIVVTAAGIIFKLSQIEWLFIAICIFGVFSLELMNSAVEKTVDLVVKDFRPLAKQAKDLAAAAVLVYAVMTVIVGLIIFLPKIIRLFW